MPQPNSPLVLDDVAQLAMGGGRIIFAHPERTDTIIKVPRKKKRKKGLFGGRRLLSRSDAFGPMWNSYIEIREFSRSVSAARRVSDIYAQFLGFVETSHGAGAMFAAVRAPDGSLAKTLYDHASRYGHEPEMEQAICSLWAEIKETWLIISDYALVNVVVTGDVSSGYKLVIVDGIGDRVLIPLQVWFRSIHQKKCARQQDKVLKAYRTLTAPSRERQTE